MSSIRNQIALYRGGSVASFVNTLMTFLHLEVSIVRLSRGEGIRGIFEEMTMIYLKYEDKISPRLDNLFGYFYLHAHSLRRDKVPLKEELIK